LAEVKSPKQSTENKDNGSSTASRLQTKLLYKSPSITIRVVENHEDLISVTKYAIGDEHYQTELIKKIYKVITLIESLKTLSKPITYSVLLETKQNRDIKVMIKNLHHSYQPINILRSLNDQGL
jgi:hypothetical protein